MHSCVPTDGWETAAYFVDLQSAGDKLVIGLGISHVELWNIKFISTLFGTTTDLSAQRISLMDIIEPYQIFGGGLIILI